MKFKEDIFPEHKDKIGGLVQFVNLPYESAVEYAWDQLNVNQGTTRKFPSRYDLTVKPGDFVHAIPQGGRIFITVETENPRWIAVMGVNELADSRVAFLPNRTAFLGFNFPIVKNSEVVSISQSVNSNSCSFEYSKLDYPWGGYFGEGDFYIKPARLSVFCENVEGWHFERSSNDERGENDVIFDFEEPEFYSRRLKKERFNPDMMLRYLERLDIRLRDVNFYSGKMTILQRAD